MKSQSPALDAKKPDSRSVHYWKLICLIFLWLTGTTVSLNAQTLHLPPRATNALTGSQFINVILPMAQTDRKNWVLAQIEAGNVPGWLRNLAPVTGSAVISGTNHTVK